MIYEDVKNLKDTTFKRLCGVRRETFAAMCEAFLEYKDRHRSRKKSNLSIENQVLLTLSFWREYRTLFHLGRDWQLHESNVLRLARRIEGILIKSVKFALPGIKRLLADDSIKYTIIDVTESLIERPKKKQKRFYSGKKKRHSLKSQFVIDEDTEQIVATLFGKGITHDLKLYRMSRLRLGRETRMRGDLGYWELQQSESG